MCLWYFQVDKPLREWFLDDEFQQTLQTSGPVVHDDIDQDSLRRSDEMPENGPLAHTCISGSTECMRAGAFIINWLQTSYNWSDASVVKAAKRGSNHRLRGEILTG